MTDVTRILSAIEQGELRAAEQLLPLVYDSGLAGVADFHQAQEGLAWLPLSTAEFALAVNRLENAHHSLLASEQGAAVYELRLLIRSLQLGKPA
jgi:hypothetical protein